MERIKHVIRIEMISLMLLCQAGCMLLWSQEGGPADRLEGFDEKYGNDPRLVNGEKYYYPYSLSEGDPFLESSPRKADIRISGEVFEDQTVRYDIYNQYLVLEYEDVYGSVSSLVLQDEWVEAFSYNGRYFKKMKGPDGKERFFQVVYEGPLSCYYTWQKEHKLDLTSGSQNYYFTDPARKAYVLMNGSFHQFRNNLTFRRIFWRDLRKEIRQYMRQHQIRIREASAAKMEALMEYCNSLVHETN